MPTYFNARTQLDFTHLLTPEEFSKIPLNIVQSLKSVSIANLSYKEMCELSEKLVLHSSLDSSQADAILACLTNELALVQGFFQFF